MATPPAPPQIPGRATWLRPLAVVMGAVALFFGLDFCRGAVVLFTHDLSFSDFWHFHYPLKHLYAAALAGGGLPHWAPELSTGFPLLAEGQVGALYPPHLLLFSLFSLPVALNWSLLLHLVLAGALTYRLARAWGAEGPGALMAAVAFGLSGFLITHAKHLNLVEAAAWIPLIVLEADRVVRREGRGALLALGVALSLLAGHPQMTYCALLAAGGVALARLPWRASSRGEIASRLARLGAAVAVGGLLAGAQLLPTAELSSLSARGEGMTWEESQNWEYHPAYLVTLVDPHAFGDPGQLEADPDGKLTGFTPVAGTQAFFWEITGYVGLIPLLLAFLGLWRYRRRATARTLAGLVALALLLALGRYGGLGRALFEVLPGYDLFRFHSRFLILVNLGLVVLAALGLTAALKGLPGRLRPWASPIAALLIALTWADLYGHFGDHNPTIDPAVWTTPPASVEAVRAVEETRGDPYRVLSYDPGDRSFISAYAEARGWKGDLTPYHGTRAVVRPNLNALYGWSDPLYYFTLAPARLKMGVETFIEPDGTFDPRRAGLFNVRHLLAASPRRPDQTGCLGGGASTCVQRADNPLALPRFYLTPTARTVAPGPQATREAQRLVMNDGFDPRREVIVEGPPRLAEIGQPGPLEGHVEVAGYTPHEVTLQVQAPRPAWLVTSDTWYPGWQARIDGEPAPIHAANVSGRAVLVPAGAHEVIFQFEPESFRIGAWLTLVGFLALLLLARRRRSTTAS